ncbi:hypothetical protein FOE78_05850 [Microlunatus elymi]|uniref:Transcriptional regulator, AbiEi antitoxin, Type IV TA system n=1 Tax=Microlunatus elymi TaxID=2596828 RepID=A0A516PWF2_9ACTN|nr:hypothetical protein [Microlunatus elymi]QDP95490.1 hypothetical protein FOE78_05850 [Microlunatus elymi]
MSKPLLARDLIMAGLEHGELRSMSRTGELRHLRRGAYFTAEQLTAEQYHRLLVEATFQLAESDSVISFGSAAVIHQLPVPRAAMQLVHLTRNRNCSGRIRTGVHVHVAPIAGPEAVVIDGLRVTSLDRTFVDLARTVRLSEAVAAGDAALRRGMDPRAVVEQLEQAKRRRGIRTARRAASVIDARSQSYGESLSRVVMIEHGLPLPELQVAFDGPDGFHAEVDFCWEDMKVIGEFDGEIKYGRLLRPGEVAGDAVFREKQREDRLRELGYIVVRWVWDDLFHPERLVARIRRALELGARLRR